MFKQLKDDKNEDRNKIRKKTQDMKAEFNNWNY